MKIKLLLILFVTFLVISQVRAESVNIEKQGAIEIAATAVIPNGGNVVGGVTKTGNAIWGTFITVARILAFATIIFAGLRYMFAGANSKADIKRQTMFIVIGCVFVFLSGTVVEFIIGVFKDII